MQIISRSEAIRSNLKFYATGEPCKFGHDCQRYTISRACVQCRKSRNKPKKPKKEPECRKAYMKTYRSANKDKITKQRKDYSEKNKEARSIYLLNNDVRFKNYRRNYKKNNPLQTFTRNSLRRIERSKSSARRTIAEHELGYTQDQFKRHIESMFENGMTWENRSEWHIDHIVPVSWWLKEGVTDVSMINALINLRPLWAKDNLSKSDKI